MPSSFKYVLALGGALLLSGCGPSQTADEMEQSVRDQTGSLTLKNVISVLGEPQQQSQQLNGYIQILTYEAKDGVLELTCTGEDICGRTIRIPNLSK